jgi:putative membrane-bound dehydrogenase-like protein
MMATNATCEDNHRWTNNLGARPCPMNRLLFIVCLGFNLLVLADEPPLPRFPPIEPTEALKTFQTRDGFRVELLAAEPMVIDPVAAAYDEDGRLYVVEMTDYPYVEKKNDKPFAENTADPPIGRVRLLIDRDGDGTFDESHIIADKLSWPTGVAVWKGGVFVAATPDIWYFKDTDGNHRADVREKVYTGFRKFNVQAVMNNLQSGLDHHIYGAASANGGQVRPADQPGAKPVAVLKQDFRFDPVTREFETISGGARFGNTFDDWGNRFLCDIRNPAQHVVVPGHYLARNPYLPITRVLHDAAEAGDTIPVYRISPPEPWRELRARRWAAIGKAYPRSELVGAGYITSSSGVTVYRGDAYPSSYRGNLFLGEVAGNLIHRETLEPNGVTFRARRAEKDVEFVASTDTWFRPVNFVNAPDGTLHILDMYREHIEHPWSIPDDIKAQLDLRSGSDRGRIYRLASPGFRARPAPKLSEATTAELVALLDHPNAWHRDTSHRLLFERQDKAAVEPLRSLLREAKTPLGRLHALWSLVGLRGLSDHDLVGALADPSAGVREHAVRLAESRLSKSTTLFERVLALAEDPAIRVRFQVAFSLGEADDTRSVEGLASIARRDAGDDWVRAAVLSSEVPVADVLFAHLLNDAGFAASAAGRATLRSLAFVIGARSRPDETEHAVEAMARSPLAAAKDLDSLLDLTTGMAEGLRRGGRRMWGVPMGPEATGLLRSLNRQARRLAQADTATEKLRERAISLIGQDPFADSKGLLGGLLEPRQPERVQIAAVRALAGYAESDVAALLLVHCRAYTPAVRNEVFGALLGRGNWIGALLDAVEAKAVHVGQIPPTRRALLMSSKDDAIRDRARALFGRAAPSARKEVIALYQEALTRSGRSERGKNAFERECVSCHRLGERGHAVGPNLASVQRRTSDEILIHILDPNREVAPDFLEYTIALKDGRIVTGLIAAETATGLTLRRAEAAEETVLRSEIEEITSTGKSLMPEGLEAKISVPEMADLLAFLLEIQK